MIQSVHQTSLYCNISTFDFALECYFIAVFLYFRVKYRDYTKSSGPGTEIIALVDITRRKALKFKVRTVNQRDTPLKHKNNLNTNMHSTIHISLISRKRYMWQFALYIFMLSKQKYFFYILSEKLAPPPPPDMCMGNK